MRVTNKRRLPEDIRRDQLKKVAIRAEKAGRRLILDELCSKIVITQRRSVNGRIPYGYVAGLVKEAAQVYPWITRDVAMNHYRVLAKVRPPTPPAPPPIEQNINISHALSTTDTETRAKGGRAVGMTNEKKRSIELALVGAKNEITTRVDKARRTLQRGKRMTKGALAIIIADVQEDRNLPPDFSMPLDTIRTRIKRKKLFAFHRGHTTPLLDIEPVVVSTIKQMCQIRQCLTPPQGIELVNSMIDGTEVQKNLVRFKKKNSHAPTDASLGTVGRGYWNGFMRRNGDQIVSRRGQKYELDRASWTTYRNFKDMYVHNYAQMEVAGVAKLLGTPQWQDKDGDICDEANAYGCKVTHEITHPEYCVVMDEVGGNINQTGDGDVGTEKYLCEKGRIPQEKVSKNNKHFTLLGLTLLNGAPLMCVMIFAGKRRNAMVELGIDPFADDVGEVTDLDYIMKNKGPGKKFPGGPTCYHNGIAIPCFCAWSEKGSMTTEILTRILETLDYLEVFDRSTGINPYLMLDGHGSRMGLLFLRYINNPAHLWIACIGVPYGTSLWQVGDSAEQNGTYKGGLTTMKKKIIAHKTKLMMPRLTIEVTEIMILVNYAWSVSFAKIPSNKKAIAERGWNPLNRNIVLDTAVRATMTKLEIETEKESGILIPYTLTGNYVELDESLPTVDVQFLSQNITPSKPNLKGGMAAWCLDAIVRNDDLMASRERIRRDGAEGESVSEKLKQIKGMTAAKMFLLGETRLGQGVLENVETSYNSKVAKQREDTQKKADTYRKMLSDAADVFALNLEPTSWNVNQLKAVLKPLKTKDDTAMPTKKAKLYERWLLWRGRTAPAVEVVGLMDEAALLDGAAPLDEAAPVNEADAAEYGCSEEEDAIAAMMMLNGDTNIHEPLQNQDV